MPLAKVEEQLRNKSFMPAKQKLTGMDRLIHAKESQLKSLKSQHDKLTERYKEEASKIESKIADITAIINALRKGR